MAILKLPVIWAPKKKPALNSMLNYPLYYTINRVFSQGLPTKYMEYRLNTFVNDTIYRDPYQMAKFFLIITIGVDL